MLRRFLAPSPLCLPKTYWLTQNAWSHVRCAEPWPPVLRIGGHTARMDALGEHGNVSSARTIEKKLGKQTNERCIFKRKLPTGYRRPFPRGKMNRFLVPTRCRYKPECQA